jgi:hypothetical protein
LTEVSKLLQGTINILFVLLLKSGQFQKAKWPPKLPPSRSRSSTNARHCLLTVKICFWHTHRHPPESLKLPPLHFRFLRVKMRIKTSRAGRFAFGLGSNPTPIKSGLGVGSIASADGYRQYLRAPNRHGPENCRDFSIWIRSTGLQCSDSDGTIGNRCNKMCAVQV